MFTKKILDNYALLTLKIGVNLQKGQGLEIVCPIERADVAHALALKGYELGAKIVNIRWEDEELDRLNFSYADTKTLCDIPKHVIDSKNYLVKNNFCYVAIAAENPSAFKDIPSEKISAYQNAKSKKLVKYLNAVMSNSIRWCVVSAPTKDWAEQVFPDSDSPLNDLSTAIQNAMRLNYDNPLKEWEKHINNLETRAKFLNEQNFEYLKYENGKGTDLMVGLSLNHDWLSAKELAKDGVPFVANIPTEEVFTAPHKDKVDGTVYSALPLSYNGQIIDNFSLTFKKGKVVDFSAEKGYGALKEILKIDKGILSLGEVAIIGKHSPIAESKILFLNTLFDENASCHLALGKCYPTTVKNGSTMTQKELSALGVNDSVEHIDFMIGTDDLKITGMGFDKKEKVIFKDGEWII